MGAPTTKLETVVIISPLKVMGLFLGIIGMICLLISMLSTFWIIFDDDIRFGLWTRCSFKKNESIKAFNCNLFNQVLIQLCGSLIISAFACSILGIIVIAIAFYHKKTQERKMKLYRAATFVYFFAVLSIAICLIAYPIFVLTGTYKSVESKWHFGWSYGIACCSLMFFFVAGALLIFDRKREEISYKECLYLNMDNEEKIEENDS